MDLPPRITVGLPVFNDPAGLRASIPSVLGQNWAGPLRLLIVDDGSSEPTREVISEYARLDDRVEVVRHPRNLGRPAARNRILNEAGADYLAWIDSDDLWTPRKLEFQMSALLAAERGSSQPLLCSAAFRWVYPDRDQVRVKVPEIGGDQLRNALDGTLQPYLWAILGRAQVFRDAGGFDERLPRRQDFEFLIRFIKGGGRVILPDTNQPLCTYSKTDVGRSPVEIAASNAVIERKHADAYQRYGRRFTLEGHRKHQLLVARFERHNNHPIRSALSSVRAHALDPLIWLSNPRGIPASAATAVRRTVWRLRQTLSRIRGTVRPAARATKRTVGRWTRAGKRRLVHAQRAFASGGALRAAHILLRGDPISVVQRAARRRARSESARDLATWVTSKLGDQPSTDETSVWLGLEERYRRAGELWSAEQMLDAGLRRLPDEPRLLLRHVELLSLRREWERCIEQWERGRPSLDAHLHAISVARIARAYLQLDRPEDAHEVTQRGVERFGADDRILVEHRRARARTIDWPAHVEVDGQAQGGAPGRVDSLGFLEGLDSPIQGHLRHPVDPRARSVALVVNGRSITRTGVSTDPAAGGAALRFSLSCDALGEYLGDGDVVEVRAGGASLPIADRGSQVNIRNGLASRSAELLDKLENGHRFTKFGELRPGHTLSRKVATLDLYEEVDGVLGTSLGLTCFPMYGNLLGAIREHDFLEHDIGGFDMAYLSMHSRPDDVRQEFIAACEHLLDAGLHLTMEPYSAMIRHRFNDRVFVDLNFAWFSPDRELGISFGWRHALVSDEAAFRRPRTCAMADRLVRVPGNAEAVLHQIYGPGWLIPDQGFQLEHKLERPEAYLLQTVEMRYLLQTHPDDARSAMR